MLSKILIKNFRAFREIEIGPFNTVNLITGLNNTGKTGILEAIFLACEGSKVSPGRSERIREMPNLFRVFSENADENENFWFWLVHNKARESDIEIKSFSTTDEDELIVLSPKSPTDMQKRFAGVKHQADAGPLHIYKVNDTKTLLPQVAVFSSHPSDPAHDAIDYNRVILKRGKKKVEKLLKLIDPRLEAIESLQTGNRAPLIYADIGLSEMIPVTHLGQGFCRLLDIYSELLAGEAKMLLIDEIENGLHHSVLPIVWKGLIAAANELDVQIFATTHSAECIFAADQAARESKPYELNLLRLDRVDGEIELTVMNDQTLETAKEFNWELR